MDTTPLAARRCVPCHGGTPPLPPDQVEALLAELPAWRLEDGKLTRTFPFPTMVEAARFAVRIAELADAEDHHPDLRVTWRALRVRLWTFAISALSENDFVLAAKIDRL
jgi:4a-hydroxytetrahydrobiopterin dehydratase